ncbi:hypothetical protein ACFWXK_37265 [Streptomyces sp. NPDC059070]|uniref:hypothetical protein n=1 Tax=Streptomyces sp. NPDC059070 TaxID=3346713 RepID=UPI0036CC9DEC
MSGSTPSDKHHSTTGKEGTALSEVFREIAKAARKPRHQAEPERGPRHGADGEAGDALTPNTEAQERASTPERPRR